MSISQNLMNKLNRLKTNLLESANLIEDIIYELAAGLTPEKELPTLPAIGTEGVRRVPVEKELPTLPAIGTETFETFETVIVEKELPTLPAIGTETFETVSISPPYKGVEEDIATTTFSNLATVAATSPLLELPKLSSPRRLPVMPAITETVVEESVEKSPLPISSAMLTSPTLRQNLPVISSPVLPTSPRTSLSGTRVNL